MNAGGRGQGCARDGVLALRVHMHGCAAQRHRIRSRGCAAISSRTLALGVASDFMSDWIVASGLKIVNNKKNCNRCFIFFLVVEKCQSVW